MNKPTITIEKAISGDTREIVAFHQNSDLQDWENEFHGYMKEDGVLYLAKDGDQIVGTNGFIPYKMNINGTSCVASRCERTLVSPDYRGQGLFAQLVNNCIVFSRERQSHFVFASTSAKKAFRKVGFRTEDAFSLHLVLSLGPRHIYQCIRDGKLEAPVTIGDLVDTVQKKDKWRGLEYVKLATMLPSYLLRMLGKCVPHSTSKLVIEEKPRSNSDLSKLYHVLRNDEPLIYLEQDESFIDWQNWNTGSSLRYYVYKADVLCAYIVCNMSSRGTATIMDVAATDMSALRLAVTRVIHEAEEQEKGFLKLSFNIRCKPLRRLLPTLLGCGFIPVYLGGNEILLPLKEDLPASFHDIQHFYITEIWHSLGQARS